jgi:hypothetical protein
MRTLERQPRNMGPLGGSLLNMGELGEAACKESSVHELWLIKDDGAADKENINGS